MITTPAWETLRYHPQQAAAWSSKARYVALPCGRQSGKTMLARRRIVCYLAVRKAWHNPLYAFVLPTFNQAKKVAWKPLLELIPHDWIKRKNETELMVETVFGSTLIVAGADQPQRLEGVQYDGVVIDESSDQKPGIFERTFLPAFAHRKGWCWRIGVPKRQGPGAAEFRKFCESAANIGGDDDTIETYSWPSADIIPPEENEYAKCKLDARDYLEQYQAKWQTSLGQIHYAFDIDLNVDEIAEYSPAHTIVVGSDFNVDPMCWVLCHKIIDSQGLPGLYVFDEIFLRNTNTQYTLNHLFTRYGNHPSSWVFIGDATGRARNTRATLSDYLQIRNDARFNPKRVLYPKSNPAIANRFSTVNALLCNAAGERRLNGNPRCKRLITDLQDRAYKPGKREPDDTGDIGHITDALGYVVYMLFPPMIDRQPDEPLAHIGAIG